MSDESKDQATDSGSGGGSSLLDNLLAQTRMEAEKEKLKLEKTLQDRADDLRHRKEEEESRRREELKKRLEEETARRQKAIRRKQDEEHAATPLSAEEKVARDAAVQQVLSTKSTVTKIERKKSSVLPVAIPLGLVSAGLAAVAVLLFLQSAALPMGLAGYRFSLENAVQAAEIRARVKVGELKTAEVSASASSGNRTVMGLQRELSELKAAVAAKDQEILALNEQIEANGKAKPVVRRKPKKPSDSIKINTNIFKGGGAR